MDSVTWNNKEFINNYDHGRQYQVVANTTLIYYANMTSYVNSLSSLFADFVLYICVSDELPVSDICRVLQLAWTLPPYGECYNPTEAGGSSDGTGDGTTSVLENISAAGNVLHTQVGLI